MTRTPLPRRVTVVEVGPRDGLQNESAEIATADKVTFIDLLSDSGLGAIEVTAFVSPKWVPQLGDAAGVWRGITRRNAVRYRALVPNLQGVERARDAGVTEIAVFAAASETFSRRNINQDIEGSFETYREVCDVARDAGMRVRGYLSTSFGCPYEGAVPADRVADLTMRLLDLGVFEVAVSDTIGIAHPGQVMDVLEVLLARAPAEQVALHFHDTRGTALANVLVALPTGIATFDASAGGLGGCPFAPGATGNLATEDLIYMLVGLGIETGVNLEALVRASRFMESRLGRTLPSRYLAAVRDR